MKVCCASCRFMTIKNTTNECTLHNILVLFVSHNVCDEWKIKRFIRIDDEPALSLKEPEDENEN